MTLNAWTDQQVLGQLVTGSSWSGNTITYAFATSKSAIDTSGGEGSGFSALTAGGQASAALALQLWDGLIAPNLQQVASGSGSNIEFGMTTTGPSYAYANYPKNGSVWFNTTYNSGTNNLVSPTIGNHGFSSYIHEIGHSLGLDHMGDYNGSGDATTDASCYQDSTVYSIMSYFGPSWGSGAQDGEGLVAWADWTASDGNGYEPQTPMLNDIMAIQSIYGADTTTRTGDTVYGFNSTIGGTLASIYDFAVNAHPILTIYDSAGTDTIDLSGFSTHCTLTLVAGEFSSCDDMTDNIAIAYGCSIENAVGGSSGDTITGNDLANILSGGGGADQLKGGAGDDTIDGGGGTDTAVFSGNFSRYQIVGNADGTYTVTDTSGASGTDILKNIEKVSFADGDRLLNHAPTVANPIADQSATPDQTFGFTFAANTFADEDAGETLNYSARLADGGALPSWLNFNAATRTFSGTPHSGDAGTVSVRVTASDGTLSVVDTFDLTVATMTGSNHAPTDLALSNASVWENSDAGTVVGQLSATDADSGDSITYALDDPSGAFVIAGATLSVAAGADLDYETRQTYSISITATDSGGLSVERDFVIDIGDLITTRRGNRNGNVLVGTIGGDDIKGLGGNDRISTLEADDTLDGGRNNDKLTGGSGSDTFVFGRHYGVDRITDFNKIASDHDVIQLSRSLGIADYDDLIRNHAFMSGGNLHIFADDGGQLILLQTDISQLQSTMVTFV